MSEAVVNIVDVPAVGYGQQFDDCELLMQIRMRVCKQCRMIFKPKQMTYENYGQFCSRECKAKSQVKGEPKICPICKEEFYVGPAIKNRCCSKECRGKYYTKTHTEIRKCENPECDVSFEILLSQPDKYCSRKCSGRHQTILGTNNRTCPHCGNNFTEIKSLNQIFCSVTCSNKGRGKLKKIIDGACTEPAARLNGTRKIIQDKKVPVIAPLNFFN
jgi:hypothetical protein